MRGERRLPTRRSVLGLAALPLALAGEAAGQTLPPGPLRIIVPFPPGGPTDAVTRIVAEEIRQDLRRPVVVQNRPGASGTLGTRAALSARADGTTLLIGNNQTQATAPFLVRDAGYNPRTDLQPIVGLADMHHVLVVRNGLGISTVSGLIETARAAPGRLNYGSTGVGSGSHLAMELLMVKTGTRMQHVPFTGAAQLIGEIAAGRLDVALAVMPTVLGQVAARSIVALATAARIRAPQLPDVPTLAQAGIAGAEAESWLALFAHAHVPDALAALLGARIRRLLIRAPVKARIEALGLSLAPRTADEFRVFQAREITRWGDVIALAGLRPE